MKSLFLAIILLLLLFTASHTQADLPGFSLGDVSFSKSNEYFPPGLYLMPGININLTGILEIELFTVNQITPSPFSINYPGLSVGYNLIGSRYKNYLNVLIEAGYLVDFKRGGALFFMVTPLSLGNVVTGCREKVLSFGLLYDMCGSDLIIIWKFLTMSFYRSS